MILALTKKELQLLMYDLHGVAVLFLMPTAFVIIMALAIPSTEETEQRQVPVNLSSSVNTISQQMFKAFLINDKYIRLLENSDGADANIKLLADFDEENLDQLELAITQQSSQLERFLIQQSIQSALAKVKLRGVLLDLEMIVEEDSFEAQVNAIESQAKIVPLAITSQESAQALPSPVQQSVPSWMIFGMFFVVLPFSQTLLKERQNSTLMRLRSFGLQSHELILSKLLPFFIINQLQFWLLIAVGYFVVPLLGGEAFQLQGRWLDYLCLAVTISFTALGLASFIAVMVRTQEQAVVIGGGLNLILAATGGIMIPKHLMSEKIHAVTTFSPMGWSLDAFQQLLVGNKGLSDIAGQLLVMFGFSTIMVALAIILFSRQFRKLGWNSTN